LVLTDYLSEWRTLLQPIVVDSEEGLADAGVAATVADAVTAAVGAAGVAVAADVAAGAAKRRRNGSR